MSGANARDRFLVAKLRARVRGEPDPVDPLAVPVGQEVEPVPLDVGSSPASSADDARARAACREAAAALHVLADAFDRVGGGEVLGRNAVASVRVAVMRGEDACAEIERAVGPSWRDDRGRVRLAVAVAQSARSAVGMARHYFADVLRYMEPTSNE